MPSKLPRRREADDLAPSYLPTPASIDSRAALLLGGAHIVHGTVQAGAQVTEAAVTATGRVLEAL